MELEDGAYVLAVEDFKTNPQDILKAPLEDVKLRDRAAYIVVTRGTKRPRGLNGFW